MVVCQDRETPGLLALTARLSRVQYSDGEHYSWAKEARVPGLENSEHQYAPLGTAEDGQVCAQSCA